MYPTGREFAIDHLTTKEGTFHRRKYSYVRVVLNTRQACEPGTLEQFTLKGREKIECGPTFEIRPKDVRFWMNSATGANNPHGGVDLLSVTPSFVI